MDKLKYYDIVGHLVPGLFFIGSNLLTFYLAGVEVGSFISEGAVSVLIITAAAYYFGQLLSAISSSIEPIMQFLWGGKPSRIILSLETSLIHNEIREKTRISLAQECNLPEDIPNGKKERKTYFDELFARAKSICNKNNLGRVSDFDAIYGLHRSLFVASLISSLLAILVYKSKIEFDIKNYFELIPIYIFCLLIATLILFFRTKKRGNYFVTEVIRMYRLEKNL